MKDKRLIGTWKSDRKLTFKHFNFKEGTRDELKKRFMAIFGKLQVSYSKTRITTSFEGVTEEEKYRVLAKDRYSVAIWSDGLTVEDPERKRLRKEFPELSGRGRNILHVNFEGDDTYWINVRDTGMREYFRRVSGKKKKKA